MKKITTFMGCVGVVCLFWGCSSEDDILTPNGLMAEEPAISSAKEAPATVSSSSTASPATSSSSIVSSDPSQILSSSSGKRDTVRVPRDSIVRQDVDLSKIETPNYSSGVFCWSDDCKTKYAGMTSNPDLQPSSSSLSIDIGMSEEAKVPPTITGTTMTDNRDNQQYKLETVEGTLWMAENINYATQSGYYCEDNDGTNMCAKYGGFYTYGVAQRICPMGWRLPTQAEVEAAKDAVDFEWWSIGGRFEISSDGSSKYGQAEEQGRYWLTNTSSNSVRIENYSSKEFNFESPDGSTRAYNVRCVEGELPE